MPLWRFFMLLVFRQYLLLNGCKWRNSSPSDSIPSQSLHPCWDPPGARPSLVFLSCLTVPQVLFEVNYEFFRHRLPEFLLQLNLCIHDHRGCTCYYLLTPVCWFRMRTQSLCQCHELCLKQQTQPILWPHFLQIPGGKILKVYPNELFTWGSKPLRLWYISSHSYLTC